ncbi:MAG TPA: glycosyltransferase [Arcobacter sp.]|nr:glycosyltransferase [Arcobacter sp.]
MKNNILIVTPKLSTSGGVSSYWNALLPKLVKSDKITNYQIGGHGKNIFGPIMDQFNFRKELKKDIDLIFLNPSLGSKSFFRDAFLAKQIIKRKLPFVVFFHGWSLDFEKKVDEKYKNFFMSTFGQAQIIFVLSNDFKNKIREWGYKGKFILETTNVDASLIANFDLKKKFSNVEKSEKIKILFLARLLREKGVFETVEAFRNLANKYTHIELTIAGDGKDLAELKEVVKDDENIIVAGYVEGQDKIDLFRDSHIYCFPTFYGEGLPTSILEAMAFGMPVITTNMGGLKEFFQDEKMGYFVGPKNVTELEKKLELLLLHKDKMIEVGTYNYAYANEKLLNTVVAKRIHSYMVNAIEGK